MALRSSSRIASIVIAFSMLVALLFVSPAPASTSESLVTCLNLQTGKERVSRTSKCPITQAVSKWRLVTADSGIAPGSSTKTMSVCSNKENSSPVYRIIRNRCSKNMQKNLYAREVTLPSKPILADIVSRSGGSASITLASDPGSGLDSPITYYTVTSSKGDVIRVTPSNSLTLIVNGLRAANDYSFTLTATNADGTSPISNVSQLVNIQAPVTPKPVTTVAQVISCANGGECAVGDTGPGGGKIFYVSSASFSCGPTLNLTCTYLEAAPTIGSSSWTDTSTAWSGDENNAIGSTTPDIGTGFKNTLAMIAHDATAGKAGTITRAYRGPNNLTDWYLPSTDELGELYAQRSSVEAFAPLAVYWSSYEGSAHPTSAYVYYSGAPLIGAKSTPYFVRPIRAGTTRTSPAFTLSSTAETLTARTTALSGYTINSTGGTIASYSISPSVPAGLTFNGSTGVLSGTPTQASAATTYAITGSNSYGTATATFRLRVMGEIGETGPGGGTIFYVATTPFACGPTRATTCNYLEAAPALWNGGLADPNRRWANITYQDATVNNASSPETATATAIGWGYFNTRAIVNQGNSDTATSAAALADSYSVTVSGVLYEDWFLPSKDELNELYLQKATVGGFTNNNFWSSSERFFVTSNAWYQFFGNGYQNLHLKGNPYYVRPIRAF